MKFSEGEGNNSRGKAMVRAAVIGVRGYVGSEVVRLLTLHPEAKIEALVARGHEGRDIAELLPSLRGVISQKCTSLDSKEMASRAEVVFLALSHGQAMDVAQGLLDEGLKVIDLSADFRLKDPQTFERWYQKAHCSPQLLQESVYGLPELYGPEIARARLLAMPGCYPTSVILALAPLLAHKLVDLGSIWVNSLSGVSGAGGQATERTHFSHCHDSLSPYSVEGHRHLPEMEQELSLLAQEKVSITFTPYLVPIQRGILSTISCHLKDPSMDSEELVKVYERYYESRPFIRLCLKGTYPQPRWVRGSNFCDIAIHCQRGAVRVFSCLDNLMKGAAGQAVQAMNLLFQLDETMGLRMAGLTP